MGKEGNLSVDKKKRARSRSAKSASHSQSKKADTVSVTDTTAARSRNTGSNLRQRKVSAAAASKWQPMSAALQSQIMSILEDTLSKYEGSGSEDTEETIGLIKARVQHKLKKLKVPNDKLSDSKFLGLAQATLKAEQVRLEELEGTLKSSLEKETQQLAQLEGEKDRLEHFAGDEQMHPILKKVQES